MILTVTGHRPNKIGGYNPNSPLRVKVRSKIYDFLAEHKPELAISGMALGVDQEFATICDQLNIPFIAAIPFAGQEKRWPADSQTYYQELLALAQEVVVVTDGNYAAYKMQKRNRWMVDKATDILAVWDGTTGGTANCVAYAEAVNKPIHRINPLEL
jgi:uncharacterized phage-like protein YoqJ